MMGVLIMGTVCNDFIKAEALWGKTQRDLLYSAFMKVLPNHCNAAYAVGGRGPCSNGEGRARTAQEGRAVLGRGWRNVLQLAVTKLPISPVFIRAAHIKKGEGGGGCMEGQRGGNNKMGRIAALHTKECGNSGCSMEDQRGGNSKTGRTAAQHIKNGEGGGASMVGQHGGNSKTGRTAALHTKECGNGGGSMEGQRNGAVATARRAALRRSTRRNAAAVQEVQRTPSTSCSPTGLPYHRSGSPLEAVSQSNVRATPQARIRETHVGKIPFVPL
jgi:hypothetical protein